jgi:hypothetical protein
MTADDVTDTGPGEEAQPDWTFQGMIHGETLSQWLDRVHPLRYDTPDGPFARCPNCEEWSPCDVRTHVAQARADGVEEGRGDMEHLERKWRAEERERIAAAIDSAADLVSARAERVPVDLRTVVMQEAQALRWASSLARRDPS